MVRKRIKKAFSAAAMHVKKAGAAIKKKVRRKR